MALSPEHIIENLTKILDADRVVTEKEVLEHSSVDRYLKLEDIKQVFTRPLPVAVVYVTSAREVAEVLKFANANGINVVPRTGNSSTEGGLENGADRTIVLDASRMDKIIKVDAYNMQVTCECGVVLETVENIVRKQGLTTGHSPQSKPLAQMGGLVATRSIGQFSTLYGGIEDMLVGVEAVFPNGHIARIKNVPRRAAGPDIRHVVMGNEGTLCFVTEVTVKLFPYFPENNVFLGYLVDDMRTGFEMLRAAMVAGYKPSVARLYDPGDGAYYFSHFSENKCVLIFMAEGPKEIADATARAIDAIVTANPNVRKVDPKLIQNWFEHLNWGPEKVAEERKEIVATNNIGHTTEVSASWDALPILYDNCIKRVQDQFGDVLTMWGGHSSHSYINGSNIYFMYYYNLGDTRPEEEVTKYHLPIVKIIVEETLKVGGSICHHHGVGKYRAPWIEDEHESAYYILETLKKAFDPKGIMNKGSIFPTGAIRKP